MRVHLILIACLTVSIGAAQTQDSKVAPSVTTLPIEEGAVTLLHLGPGYTTSLKLPEEISSVVIGNPASFKAEHSDAEPRLVFLKPITTQPSESNALITTKSGQEIPLHLVSAGKASANAQVDFFVEYSRPRACSSIRTVKAF
jgi:type IV secretory pathway VirB9-like protein